MTLQTLGELTKWASELIIILLRERNRPQYTHAFEWAIRGWTWTVPAVGKLVSANWPLDANNSYWPLDFGIGFGPRRLTDSRQRSFDELVRFPLIFTHSIGADAS